MDVVLAPAFADSACGKRARDIVRRCVHCGMCNAVCPTYRLTGNELDGPRGRIYLIKSLLEEGEASEVATEHMDRCLTCRACETACPSGVAYGELAEVARPRLQSRSMMRTLLRRLLVALSQSPRLFSLLFRIGRRFRWLVPPRIRALLTPVPHVARRQQRVSQGELVIVLQGCVQRACTPQVNASLQTLLESAGIQVTMLANEACCGALALHLGEVDKAERIMQRGLDLLSPHLNHAKAVISTASGCGVTLKDYHKLLGTEQAKRFADKVVDASEFLAKAGLALAAAQPFRKVAWHSPCTLQHGQRLGSQVESMLEASGYELAQVVDENQCCGSAGSYSLFEPEMAAQLRRRKLESLRAGAPEAIATANVGCQMFLGQASEIPVYHWLELVKLRHD